MRTSNSRPWLILGSLLLSASLVAPLTHAQPPHARGQAAERSTERTDSYRQGSDTYRRSERIDLDEALIRSVFREHREYLQPDQRLPPGIQRNLARGKPLPPGIAKRFDGRVQQQLPRYEGYEWRQVGRDAVLVAATTGIVEAILENILD
ncbi:MAG: hypothetical protein EA348_06700 [Pseudomonadaceae bacterium]|nr:MAG: hypothetical protein EA348_06700 [Pseudomonadaceae bacterium]